MLNFKEYLAESKQSLWSDALNSKPEKYGAGFVDLVKADFWFDTIGGEESVQLDKSNTKLLDILSGALGKEGLADALYDADPNQSVLKWGRITKTGQKQSPTWKATNSKNQTIYIPLNSLGKANVKPSETPTGGEWEGMISIGYNMKRLGEIAPTQTTANKGEYGISAKEFKQMKKDFWGKWGESAIQVGNAFYDTLDKSAMTQYGAGSGTLSGDWKNWGGKNATPKTDMYLGSGEAGQRISLKKKGGSQLMSAAKNETIATFKAAMQLMGDNNNKEVGVLIEDIKEKFQTIDLGGTLKDLKDKKGFANPKNMSQKTHDDVMNKVASQEDVNTEIGNQINELLNNNQSLKEYFVFEAASGYTKFGNTKATADFVIEFDPTKEGKSTIAQYREFGDMSGKIVVSKDIVNLANKTDFYCSFKTGAKSPYTSLRTKERKEDERKSKSNEQYDIPTLRNLIIDHIESNELTKTFLPENFEQLDEFALLNRAIQGIKRGATRLKSTAKDMYMNLTVRVTEFLKGLYKKVFAVLDKIKKLAGKALHALMRFFGFEIDNATSKGPAIIFAKMV
tara:strand:+ start:778 stop:2475 length:1698 start_codon:yes stop_codon:yes gene_type:complete